VTYADLSAAKAVVLVGFEPEEESPIVFLRAARGPQGQDGRVCRGPLASHGLEKLSGTLLPTVPEPRRPRCRPEFGCGSRGRGIILIGERMATRPARWPLRSPWPPRPEPAWPGSRVAPVSAVLLRPVRSAPCFLAVAR
jgi:hypothetical protein